MSYELASRQQPSIFSVVGNIFSGWRRAKYPKYEPPWTAFGPARYAPCDSATGDSFPAKLKRPFQMNKVDVSSEVMQMLLTSPDSAGTADVQTAIVDATEVETEKTVEQPVKLRLVSNQDAVAKTDKPVMPGLAAATGRDFQLAARLSSVSAQNRKVAPAAVARTAKSTGLNRPVKQVTAAKRSLKIEPPAVGRKTRASAQVVQLQLTLARAEHKQAKALKSA